VIDNHINEKLPEDYEQGYKLTTKEMESNEFYGTIIHSQTRDMDWRREYLREH